VLRKANWISTLICDQPAAKHRARRTSKIFTHLKYIQFESQLHTDLIRELFSKSKNDRAVNYSDRDGNGDEGSSTGQLEPLNLGLERILMFSNAARCSKSHFSGLIPHTRNLPFVFMIIFIKVCFVGN
jgi:hypothetical protein